MSEPPIDRLECLHWFLREARGGWVRTNNNWMYSIHTRFGLLQSQTRVGSTCHFIDLRFSELVDLAFEAYKFNHLNGSTPTRPSPSIANSLDSNDHREIEL